MRLAAGSQSEQLAQDLGENVLFATTDVTDEVQVTAAIAATCSRFGALHGAINCAGIAPGERVLGKNGPHRLESFSRTVQINLVGTFNVTRLAAQVMEKTACWPP